MKDGQWCEVQSRLPIQVIESGNDVAQFAAADSDEKSEKTGIMITGAGYKKTHRRPWRECRARRCSQRCAAADSTSGRHSETWGRRAATWSVSRPGRSSTRVSQMVRGLVVPPSHAATREVWLNAAGGQVQHVKEGLARGARTRVSRGGARECIPALALGPGALLVLCV